MGAGISKPDMIHCRSGGVDGTKVDPSTTGCGMTFLPAFLHRRNAMRNEKFYMDATTSRFFHGNAATSDSAAPSSGSSTGGCSSSCGSNGEDHVLLLDHDPTTFICANKCVADSGSYVDHYAMSNSRSDANTGVLLRSSATIDELINDFVKSQDRSGCNKVICPSMQQIQIHHSEHCSESVGSHGTIRSILSTATPFCVFNDDDNNTVVTFKVVHQPIYETESCIFDEYLPDSSNHHSYEPEASSNQNGDVADAWSSNWNEMCDDDTISSAGAIRSREVQRPQEEIVLVRSKCSSTPENSLRANCSTASALTKSVRNRDVYSEYVFPWDAYKKTLSSGASTTTAKQPKSSSRMLPNVFHRTAYVLVEL